MSCHPALSKIFSISHTGTFTVKENIHEEFPSPEEIRGSLYRVLLYGFAPFLGYPSHAHLAGQNGNRVTGASLDLKGTLYSQLRAQRSALRVGYISRPGISAQHQPILY